MLGADIYREGWENLGFDVYFNKGLKIHTKKYI